MKKRLCLLLLLTITCGLIAGCADQTTRPAASDAPKDAPSLVGNIPIAFPLTASPQTLKIIITGFDGKPQDDVYVWRKYEGMTGVHAEFLTVAKEKRAEEVYNALTNKKPYDIILRCKLSATSLTRYGKSGLILDLAKDGLLETYAPNCYQYLRSHPDTLASVMDPDGAIYALPQVNAGAELRVALKLYVNKSWLERVGGKLPTTTEELRELLTAFRDQDANGNGDPNDEIPLCGDWDSVSTALYGAFGLANRGFHNTAVDCDPETGKARFVRGCDAYRKFLAYMNGLYTDRLIDKNVFSVTNDQLMGSIAADRVGVFANTNLALLPADKADQWVAVGEALTGPDGDKMWTAIRANFHSTGAAVIPSACKNPELALRWLDFFWTDAGTLFYHMGVEGETYQSLANGGYDYLPEIYAEMKEKNLSFDAVISAYSPYPGGSNPTVEIAPYFMGGEMADIPAQAARTLMTYGPEAYWPSFTFTQEENGALDAVKGDLNKYCDTMQTDFVTGAQPLSAWDGYIGQLDELGVQDMLRIYQAAIGRYDALIESLR